MTDAPDDETPPPAATPADDLPDPLSYEHVDDAYRSGRLDGRLAELEREHYAAALVLLELAADPEPDASDEAERQAAELDKRKIEARIRELRIIRNLTQTTTPGDG